MPFSIQIDPSRLPAMRAAFDRVCGELGLRGERDDPFTHIVVRMIAGHAETGELDQDRLFELAMRDLAPEWQKAAAA